MIFYKKCATMQMKKRSMLLMKIFYEFISDLSNDFRILNKWFCDNYKLLNIDRCYFMTLKSSSNL